MTSNKDFILIGLAIISGRPFHYQMIKNRIDLIKEKELLSLEEEFLHRLTKKEKR